MGKDKSYIGNVTTMSLKEIIMYSFIIHALLIMPIGVTQSSDQIESKYQKLFSHNSFIDMDTFMQNNYRRASTTVPIAAAKHCSYDVNSLIRDTAIAEGNYEPQPPSSNDVSYDPAIAGDIFTTFYRVNDNGVTIMSMGNLYIDAPQEPGYCDIPVYAFPQESGPNHGACIQDNYSIYTQISKRYLNRYAKIWLAIWPGQQKHYKFNNKEYHVLGPYDRFLLQSVSEGRSERVQIAVPTAPDWPEIVYFFGRNPLIINLNFVLFNTITHNWKEQFIQMYETMLRGTRLVENKTSIYISFEDVLICGYLLNMSFGETAVGSDSIPVNLTMLVTRRNTLHTPLIYQGQSVLDPSFMKLYTESIELQPVISRLVQQEAAANATELLNNLQGQQQ